jgi:hypothetical protein
MRVARVRTFLMVGVRGPWLGHTTVAPSGTRSALCNTLTRLWIPFDCAIRYSHLKSTEKQSEFPVPEMVASQMANRLVNHDCG